LDLDEWIARPVGGPGGGAAFAPPQIDPMTFKIAVLPGDGIGQEVTAEAVRVLRAVTASSSASVEFEQALVGGAAIDATGAPLPPETLKLCQSAHAILFGSVGGPRWDHLPQEQRAERGLLALRKELDLYANLRPATCFPMLVDASPLKRSVVEGTDIMVIRELTGGLYFGEPRGRTALAGGGERGVNTMAYTTAEIERVARVGFDVARTRRKRLASVDKANVLTVSQLWRDVVTDIAKDYPDVTLEHVLVDNCAMALVQKPTHFDTIVTENTFGDILSDEAAILAGSMGMLPSAALGLAGAGGRAAAGRVGLYEPVHGTAPDIAGQGIANPIAAILSAAMLLRYSLNMPGEADRIEAAVRRVLEQGHRTRDIAARGENVLGTKQMGDLIVRGVERPS
jgi:3-isopropylmalate dehydrogenase